MRRSLIIGFAGLGLVLGCGPGEVSAVSASGSSGATGDATGSTTGPVGTVSSSTGLPSGGSSTSSGGSPTTTSGGSTGSASSCGNGVVDPGEECDDDTPQCRSDCLLACRFVTSADVVDDAGGSTFLIDADVASNGDLVAVGWLDDGTTTSVYLAHRAADLSAVSSDTYYSGDGGKEYGTGVVVEDDGSMFVVVAAHGESTPTRVLHYDVDGNLDWSEPSVATQSGLGFSGGVARLPGGDVVTSSSLPVSGADTDILVSRYEAAGPLWTATWSSDPATTASNDVGGPIAASSAGIYVMGTQPSVLGGFGIDDPVVAAFGNDGGSASWVWSEYLMASNLQLWGIDAAVDPSGRVLALFQLQHGSGSSAHFQLRVLDPDGTLVRTFDSQSLSWDGGEQAGGMVVDGDGRVIVLGSRVGLAAGNDAGATFVVGFDDGGATLCAEPNQQYFANIEAAVMDDGGDAVVAGGIAESQTSSQGTVARFRGF